MDGMIRNLYINLIQDIETTDTINEELKKEIIRILEDGKGEMKNFEYEQCKNQAFRIASAAEESGFVRGFRYAFRLIMECYQE